MDKLQAMNVFVRVVETGSFSAVAREARATQSAVSKQVAALESNLGVRLLSRTTRSLTLTEEGEQYFKEARRLVSEVTEAESTLKRGHQQLTGWLHVGASGAFGRLKLMPVIQSFLAAHPAVKIDLQLHDTFIDLVSQGVDVAVRIGELVDSTLIARRIGSVQRTLLAHRRYLRSLPKNLNPPTHPDELHAHNCIVYSELATRNAWSFTAGAGAADAVGTTKIIRVDGQLQTNSSEIVRASVLAGMGISYSPTWLFDDELRKGEIQALMTDWITSPMPIHLVSPRERRDSAKVRAFAEHAAKMMA